mmetsp:Transcript_17296/g.47916  ORF Transcript_17296/g.47916 Transcript_17296/m.47916 type:complete len:244 (+) Transcript_17296:511-1242(+)
MQCSTTLPPPAAAAACFITIFNLLLRQQSPAPTTTAQPASLPMIMILMMIIIINIRHQSQSQTQLQQAASIPAILQQQPRQHHLHDGFIERAKPTCTLHALARIHTHTRECMRLHACKQRNDPILFPFFFAPYMQIHYTHTHTHTQAHPQGGVHFHILTTTTTTYNSNRATTNTVHHPGHLLDTTEMRRFPLESLGPPASILAPKLFCSNNSLRGRTDALLCFTRKDYSAGAIRSTQQIGDEF